MGFVINNEIKDAFDDIRNIASILSRSSVFEQGVSIEELVDWEKDNAISMPDMYKSWLLLTSYARIMDGRIELFFQKSAILIKKMYILEALGMVLMICIFQKIQGLFIQSVMTKKNMKIFLISLHMFK